jgi:hypothetical protein
MFLAREGLFKKSLNFRIKFVVGKIKVIDELISKNKIFNKRYQIVNNIG